MLDVKCVENRFKKELWATKRLSNCFCQWPFRLCGHPIMWVFFFLNSPLNKYTLWSLNLYKAMMYPNLIIGNEYIYVCGGVHVRVCICTHTDTSR